MAIENDLTFHRYRYIPKDVVLTLDKNYEFRDGAVVYINLMFDYIGHRLPVIQMGIECDNETIAQIYKHQDIAQMKFCLDEHMLDENNNPQTITPYLRETLSLIPARDQNVYITNTDINVEQKVDNLRLVQLFEFYLVDLEKVKWFDAERNFAVEKTTLPAMLQSIFINRGIPANTVVATPPMQDVELKKVVLPLGTMVNNIRALNSKYGLYDNNPIIFWDMKFMYCISKRDPNVVLKDEVRPYNEDFGTVTFLCYNPDNSQHESQGSVDDSESSTHYINLNDAPRILDQTTKDTYTKTSTVVTVDKDGQVDTKTTLDEEATKVTYVYSENDLTKAQVINELINGPTVSVVCKDISIKCLRPYKAYNFLLDTSYRNLKLQGRTFRLVQFSHSIHREGINSYIGETSMILSCPNREAWEKPTTD